MGHGGVGAPQKKLFTGERGEFRYFLGDFQQMLAAPASILTWFGHVLRFSAQNPIETLKPGQTSDRNGFSTLKIEGYHAANP